MTAPETVSYRKLMDSLMVSTEQGAPHDLNEFVELVCTLQLLQELVEEEVYEMMIAND